MDGSRMQLVGEKIGVRERPQFNEQAIKWGIENEKNARSVYEAITGAKIRECGFEVHSEHDWLGGSADGEWTFCGKNTGLEIKCPRAMYDSIPDRYMPQIQGLGQIMGWDECDFVVWTPQEMQVWTVEISQEYWDWMFPMLEECWAYIQAKTLPGRTQKRPVYPGKINIRRLAT